MRRFALLLAGAALWLFLAALPALADGGPHVAAVNSGSGTGSTLTADSCAGCHRAHTAQGPKLVKAEGNELCLSCHGVIGAGATTNVEDGVQYTDSSSGTVVGALRGGGFVNARIDSTNPVRIPLPRWDSTKTAFVASFSSRIPPSTSGSAATSAHLKLTGANGVVLQGTAWGNGALNSGVGAATVTLECVTCHNPHGNGLYRILNPIPTDDTGPLVEATAGTSVSVAEMRGASSVSGARNYTVLWGSSLATIVAGTGDYWRRYQPYDAVPIRRSDFNTAVAASNGTTCASNPANTGTVNCPTYTPANYFRGDAPEFVPAGSTGATSSTLAGTWRTQLAAWCSTCHTRYMAPSGSWGTPSGDAIYKYRHPSSSPECTQCHVAHGSNAKMPGSTALGTNYSGDFSYPVAAGGTAAHNGSSRLLKVDNRGTCQQCHDPTGTVPIPTATYP